MVMIANNSNPNPIPMPGQRLGATLTSLDQAGQRGELWQLPGGRNGQKVVINTGTGNLVVQDQDAALFDHGLDAGVLRTYNSRGQLTDDNGDNWITGMNGKRLDVTGVQGADGSSITRTDLDGAQSLYTWDAAGQGYFSTQGAGFDTIALDNGQLLWTDGGTGLIEAYDSASGRLQATIDPSGHRIDYQYNADGLLTRATTDTGESTSYDYNGRNLSDVRTHSQDADGVWQDRTLVHYDYDILNRLSAVTVKLDLAGTQDYLTSYTYDGNSTRLATISQDDGSHLTFAYVQTGTDYRVASVTNALQEVTSFSYDLAGGVTTVTDPLSLSTVLHFRADGQLTQIDQPALEQAVASTRFEYDADGNLSRVVDPLGRAVDMAYDSQGNQILRRDAAGDTVTRSYDALNQLRSETIYLTPDADGAGAGQPSDARTTRYYYDAPSGQASRGLLRYMISAEGRITEYRYNAQRQRVSTLSYAGQTLDPSQLQGDETTSTIADLVRQATSLSGSAAQSRTDIQRSDMRYDAHGSLAGVVSYASVLTDANATGVIDGAAETRYVYDQAGRLLSKLDVTMSTQTSYTYDGLDRVLTVSNGQQTTSVTQYDDANNRVTVTGADGTTTTSVFDRAGRLVSVAKTGVPAALRFYDADGRLRMTQDAAGVRAWTFYDADSRIVGSVDANGRLTETIYNLAGDIAQTVAYATAVDAGTLADGVGAPTNLSLAETRPAAAAGDQKNWRAYDDAGRLLYTIGADGAVVKTQYDGASRAVAHINYANRIDASNLASVLAAADVQIVADALNDQTSRSFYDGEGLLAGSLDASGSLVQCLYSGAGQLLERRAYATLTTPALRAAGSLTQLLSGLKGDNDVRTLYSYNGKGEQVSQRTVTGYPEEAPPGIHTIAGVIDQPGEQDVFQLSVVEKSRFFFDGVQGDQTQWTLNSGSTTLFSSRDLTASSDKFFDLDVGSYRLTVDAVGDKTGNYTFRLLGEEAAVALDINQSTTGQLQPAAQAALYSFSAQAGDRLFFQSGTSSSSLIKYTVFGPDAAVISSVNGWSDSGALTATRSGTYWLSIEGQPAAPSQISYAFTVFRQTPPTQILTLGATTQLDLTTPGAAAFYEFDVSDVGWLRWDQIFSVANNVRWTLSDAAGNQINTGIANGDESSLKPMLVAPGRYRLALESTARQNVAGDFRLLYDTVSSAADLQSGQTVSISSATGHEDRVYKLHVDGQTNLSLALAITTPSAYAHWQVADAQGRIAGSGWYVSNNQAPVVALPSAGDYYLFLGGNLTNSTALDGSVTVAAWTDQTIDGGTIAGDQAVDLAGTVAAAGQVVTTKVHIAQAGSWVFESLNLFADGQWQLVGPNGTVVDWRKLNATQAQTGLPVYLSAGDYQFKVRGQTTGSGAFALHATPVATAAALAAGTPAAVSDLAIGASLLFQTDAAPLDRFGYALGAPNGQYNVMAFDAYGRVVGNSTSGSSTYFQSQASGPLFWRVTRLTSGGVANLTLTRTPAVPPAAVTGTPILLGQAAASSGVGATSLVYDFDVAADGWVALEWQSGNWANWTLSGPRGTEVNGAAIASGSWKMPLAWAPAGHYQMKLTNGSGAAGFTLVDTVHARSIASDTPIAVDLTSSDTYALFDVALDAGRNVDFHGLPGASTGNTYRLYDSAGVLVASGDPATLTFSRLNIPRSGHYLLAIGKTGGTALRFAFAQTQRDPLPLQWGASTQGSFSGYGQIYSYAFSTGTGAELSVNETLNGGSANSYSVLDAYGNTIGSLASVTGKAVFAVGPGVYTLRVTGAYSAPTAPVPFAFTANLTYDTVNLPADGAGTATVNWTNGLPDRQIQMSLQNGQSYWLTTPALGTPDNLGYRVLDPQGIQVMAGTLSYYTQGVAIKPPVSGTYTLQISGTRSGQFLTGATSFTLRTGLTSAQPYSIGSAVDVSLNHPADKGRYQFTLTEPTRVWLDVTGDSYQASLVRTDIAASVFAATNIAGSGLRQVVNLAAGSYELQLAPTQISPGRFHISTSAVSALPTFTVGSTANVTAANGRVATAWRIAGVEGQKLLIDARVLSGVSPHQFWTLTGPAGEAIASGNGYQYSDAYAQKVSLPRDGDYVLSFYGNTYTEQTARSSTMRVLNYSEPVTNLTPGTQVSGTLASPGNINHYRFTLDQDTTILIDPHGGTANLSLNGPRGNELGFALTEGDSRYFTRQLPAGTYTVDVSGTNTATPSFSFRLLALPAAAVDHGNSTAISGDLPAGRTLVAHQFDVVPGASYNLDFTTPRSYPDYFQYALVDAYGRTINANTWTSQSVSFNAPQTGPVYLLAKQIYASSGPVHFDAVLRQPLNAAADLTWDAAITASLATRQDQSAYRFEMIQPGWVELQGVRAPSGSVVFEIVAPDGAVVGSRQSFNATQDGSFACYVPAGKYAVRIRTNADQVVGTAQFIARQIPAARQLGRQGGVARSIQLPDGSDTLSFWALDARVGDHLEFAANAWTGTGSVQILAPNGSVVRTWSPASGGSFSYDFTRPGTHLLRVQRAVQGTVPSNAVDFSATWGTVEAPQPVVSTFNAAGAIAANTSQTFQFELTESGLWYIDRNTTANVYASAYQHATITDANGATVVADYRQPRVLSAGLYTLTVRQDVAASSYDFKLRRLDLAQVQTLSYGQPVTLPLSSNTAASIYKIDAAAGDMLQFNALGVSGAYGSEQWTLVNAYGQPFSAKSGAAADASPLQIDSTGPVYLLLENNTYAPGTGSVSFQIDNVAQSSPQAISLGQTVSGTLNPQTESRSYTLTLTDAQTIQFDRLNTEAGNNIYWKLSGPYSDGTLANDYIYPGTQTPPYRQIRLQPGQYTVTAYATGFSTGTYAFRLLAAPAATPLINGQWIDGQSINASGEMATYSIDAQAGDRLFIDLRNQTLRTFTYNATQGWHYNYTGGIRVIDPNGLLVASGDLANTELVAPVSGRYTIELDDSFAGDEPFSYSLAVFVNHGGAPRIIDLGVAQQAVDLVVRDAAVTPLGTGAGFQSGGSIRVNWTTANNGVQATHGDFSEHIIVRNAATGEVVLQAAVPYSEQAAGNGPLLAGQSIARSAELRLPDGPAGAGELSVTIETDANYTQDERGAAAANNVASTTLTSTLAAYPNLQVADLSFSPSANWQAGDTVTVQWNTSNNGTAPAQGQWHERVELVNLTTGALIAAQDLPQSAQDIAPGTLQARSATITWPAGLNAIGSFRLRVMVDSRGELAEYGGSGALESDNLAERLLAVGPDLTVRNVGLLEPSPYDGDTVTIVWEDVNQGAVATPAAYQDRVVVRARNADGSAGAVILNTAVAFPTDSGQPLLAGAARTRSLRFALPQGVQGSGNFDVTVTADSNTVGVGSIFETSAAANHENTAESNNSAVTSFSATEHAYANLAVTDMVVPSSINSGDDVVVSWTVSNHGAAQASGSWVDRLILTSDNVAGNADDILLANVKYSNTSGLDIGDSYTQSATVHIPSRLLGSYKFAVLTDANQSVSEPDTRSDNVRLSGNVSIAPTFTDLAPSLTLVPAEAYAGRVSRVEWTVQNNGNLATDVSHWVDQVYLSSTATLAAGAVLLGSVTHVGAVAVGGTYASGLDFTLPANTIGSYYFIVKTDAFANAYEPGNTGNNIAPAGTATTILPQPKPNLVAGAIDAPNTWRVGDTVQIGYTVTNTGNDAVNSWMAERLRLVSVADATRAVDLASPSATRQLAVGGTYTNRVNLLVPSVPAGAWRLEVAADGYNFVSELNEADNIASTVVTVSSPDLAVEALTSSGKLQGGETVTLNWNTRNLGSADAANVRDIVYLSRDGSISADDIKLGEISHDLLAFGASISSELTCQLPIDSAGTYRLIVVTDPGHQINEGGATANNQVFLDADIARDAYADLIVTSVSVPGPVIADPASATITYTVTNQGSGAGRTLSWTDVVVYSAEDMSGRVFETVLGKVMHEGGLAAGDSYTGTVTYQFGPGVIRHGQVKVRTDAEAKVWENGFEANNVAQGTLALDVLAKPYADLKVESVTTSGQALSGQPLTVSWTVANRGIGLTDSGAWPDTVWLSAAADGSGKRYPLVTANHLGLLDADETYTSTVKVILPEGIEGAYYVHVQTAGSNGPFEFIYGGNNSAVSLAVPVQLSPAPDLTVSSIDMQETEAQENSLINLSWTVINQGSVAAAGQWDDKVELVPVGSNSAPILLGTFSYLHGLEPGIQYTRSEQVRVPARIQGEYRIRVTTNSNLASGGNNQVYETGAARTNNVTITSGAIEIRLAPRPDLQVGTITLPETINAGTSAAVSFTITNMGTVATSGQWTDAVYLSLDGKLGPNAVLLGRVGSGAALAPGESYTGNIASFNVPLRYRGDAYIIVETDNGHRVDEFPNETNNIGVKKFYAQPVPLADLVTGDIVAPVQATHGASFEVRYRVANLGSATTRGETGAVDSWTDTVWLTKDRGRPSPAKGDILLGQRTHTGHLALNEDYLGDFEVELPDNLVSGKYFVSVWSDTYGVIPQDTLATNVNPDDPTGVQSDNYKARAIDILGITKPDLAVISVEAMPEAVAGGEYSFKYSVKSVSSPVSGQWSDTVWLSDTPYLNPDAKNWLIGAYSQPRTLANGEVYSVADTVKLGPSVTGKYLIVQTNSGEEISEFDEPAKTNNTKAVESSVISKPSDLRVTAVVTQPVNFSGEDTTVTWTVTNTGADVWKATRGWLDNIYFSADPQFISSRVTPIGSIVHWNPDGLGAGQSYTSSATVKLPPGTNGNYYIHVLTDARHFGKLEPSFSLGPQEERPNPDAMSNDNAMVRDGLYRESVFEGDRNDNNIGQGILNVTYREPDLQVDSITLSDPHPMSGQTVTATWTVTNHGNRATRVDSWYDGLFLSRDEALDASDYPLVDRGDPIETRLRVRNTSADELNGYFYLQPGASYTNSATFVLPTSISGDFHLIVKADTDIAKESRPLQPSTIRDGLDVIGQFDKSGAGAVKEFRDEADNIASIALSISLATPPDLVVTEVSTGESVVIAGQNFTVNYHVANQGGDTPADQGKWNDLIYLSKDRNLDLDKDAYVGYVEHKTGLNAGGGYDVALTVNAPSNLSGSYYVFVVPDPARSFKASNAAVIENNKDNNAAAAAQPIVIEVPPPADLKVTQVTVPASASIGEQIQIDYSVSNDSANPARGSWTDGVYLSDKDTWDLSATLVGKVMHSGDLLAGASYAGTLTAKLPPLKDGHWRVLVRPDLYNEVFEGPITYDANGLHMALGEANNLMASSAALNVTVPALTVAVPLETTLTAGQSLLYKVSVAAGETLRVSLDSSAVDGANEIYVRYGEIPSGYSYDAAYDKPVSPSQQAIIPGTQAGDYYILVRSRQTPAGTPVAPVTLRADLMPLAITRITPDDGGTGDDDHRWVTMDIEGARFKAGALVKLSRPGVFEIQPERWQVLDATHIRAIFDLRNVPHGLYDVEVLNPNGETVIEAYRYLVDRAIEADVTIGIGGPRRLEPGDSALYSVALQSLTNIDTPYVRFDVGATNMGASKDVLDKLNLPYLTFASNIGGQPDGPTAPDSANTQAYGATPLMGTGRSDIPWAALDGTEDTNGYNLAPGYAFDVAGRGFVGASFSVQTYPGLKEWLAQDFEGLRDKLYAIRPEWKAQGLLDGGVDSLDNISPGLAEKFQDPESLLTRKEALAMPFRFNVFGDATPLTRDEFIAEQSAYASKLRDAILKDAKAPASLQVLAADGAQWTQGWLAALETAGLLRQLDQAPPIRINPKVLSLNATLASGILLGHGGDSYQTKADILGFFNTVQKWYGNTARYAGDPQSKVAKLDYEEERSSFGESVKVPVMELPQAADFSANAAHATHFLDFNVFAGNISEMEYLRHIGLLDYEFNPIGPKALNLTQYLLQAASRTSAQQATISVSGPQIMPDAQGATYVPAAVALPYNIAFQNPTEHAVGEMRIVTQLDPNLDARTLRLNDIKIGDLNVHIPADRAVFQGDFDFTGNKGFILRVSGGVDAASHTATWLLQAIDASTGEVLKDPVRGLLLPNPKDAGGAASRGFVSYTVQASETATTGTRIDASARILIDGIPPVDSEHISYTLDAQAPHTSVTVRSLSPDADGAPEYSVVWKTLDDASGVRHVTVFVAEDGGDFHIWQKQVASGEGQAVFTGKAGHTYEFLAAATDNAGNREAASVINAVLPDDGSKQQVIDALGANQTLRSSTELPLAVHDRTYPANDLFQTATQHLPGFVAPAQSGDLQSVLAPMMLRGFADGYAASGADIGALAMIELPDHSILASGGLNRNEVYAYPKLGGHNTTPLFALDAPILDMALDRLGQLWVMTGNELLQVDSTSGAVLSRHAGPAQSPLTHALAIDPDSGVIYVSSYNGVEIFDPKAAADNKAWKHFSNNRVGDLAFGPDGRLWGVRWTGSNINSALPQATTDIISFPMSGREIGRAQLEYRLAGIIDSIAFGQDGTPLAGLLLASANLPQRAVVAAADTVPQPTRCRTAPASG